MADEKADWIAVDWGSSRLRAWAMSGASTVLDTRASDDGSAGLSPDAFEGKLIDLVGDWLSGDTTTPVIICGMAGSRQGWIEAPYAALPATTDDLGAAKPDTSDARIDVRILGGVCQADPADVMRGEETQIAGLVAQRRGFSGLACLPGTHCKWVGIENGTLTRMWTAMTGEMFALLSKSSVLRHSVDGGDWDEAAFEAGVKDALAAPLELSSKLFSIRADGLLNGTGADKARARLSGLLIGAEVAASRARAGDAPVHLIGAPELTALYARALELAGIDANIEDGERMTLAGLIAAHERLSEVV